MEYIDCTPDPELKVLAMRYQKSLVSGTFACGHPRVIENTYVCSDGRKAYHRCKTCQREKTKHWHEQRLR
jgi:hypothetical protein